MTAKNSSNKNKTTVKQEKPWGRGCNNPPAPLAVFNRRDSRLEMIDWDCDQHPCGGYETGVEKEL